MDNADTNTDTESHQCLFNGCNKTFSRKEHLARHTLSHSSSSARHVCRVCLKEFSRSDSLRRHLSRHGDSFKPEPSGRSKRACVSCHSTKTKCDGEQPCSRCVKKSSECIYEQANVDLTIDDPETPARPLENVDHPDPPIFVDDRVVLVIAPDASQALMNSSSIQDGLVAATPQPETQPEPQARISEENLPIAARIQNSQERRDWVLSTRVEKDEPRNNTTIENNPFPISEALSIKYWEAYFAHFHHRWPIIHAPSMDRYGPNIALVSVTMIGAWLHGTRISKAYALKLHAKLVDELFKGLPELISDETQQPSFSPLPPQLQAALLNIIFGLYSGSEEVLSKCILLRNILVGVLRDIHFFHQEVPYDKPATFRPYRTVIVGERSRLAAYLFKMDCYLSMSRNQPGLLYLEDLDFQLPSTHAMYNADGFSAYETRSSIEPPQRSKRTIYQSIRNLTAKDFLPGEGTVLVEDVQLAICAVYADIWRAWEEIRTSRTNKGLEDRQSLRIQLDSRKDILLQVPIRQPSLAHPSIEDHIAVRFYYGCEDHSEVGWPLKVFPRPKHLCFDSWILYHLLSLQLCTDIRTLRQLSRDATAGSSFDVYGDPYQKAKEQRTTSTRQWTLNPDGRRALHHTASILVSYNDLSGLDNESTDPIIYVGLAVGALVIWAFCEFGAQGCEHCIMPTENVEEEPPSAELTKWCDFRNDRILMKHRDEWIETGNRVPLILGNTLCVCNRSFLLSKFRNCFPEGWDLADSISAGVVKRPSST